MNAELSEKSDEYRFSQFESATSERDRLLAASIANQQRAGFKSFLDIRQFDCPDCSAPGFNSGWGTINFTCGSSWLGGEDSEPAELCEAGKKARAA